MNTVDVQRFASLKHLRFSSSGLHAEGPNFYLNGRPFRIVSGSFHYFRTQPAQWGDRLERMKAAGLNTVTTYVPWNLHERVRNVWHGIKVTSNSALKFPLFVELTKIPSRSRGTTSSVDTLTSRVLFNTSTPVV